MAKLAAPVAVVAVAAAGSLYPRRTLHAEEPQEQTFGRKPIYSDPPITAKLVPKTTTTDPATASPSPRQTEHMQKETPTTLLAHQIRQLRLRTYSFLSTAESHTSMVISRLLSTEHSITTRLLSLPAPDERLLPSTLYILVATLTGTILTRNRNILFRATFPAALGLSAAWVVLPGTMRNVSALVAEIEEGIDPRVREEHVRIVKAVGSGVDTLRKRGKGAVAWGRGAVKGAREETERLVRGERRDDDGGKKKTS